MPEDHHELEPRKSVESSGSDDNGRLRTPSDEMFHAALSIPKFARACLRDLFPDKVKLLDLRKLTIEQSDFYTDSLEKRVADFVYTAPLRDSSAVAKFTLILEHKGQSSPSEDRLTFAKLMSYVAEYCRRESLKSSAEATNQGVQPNVALIYTGEDANLTNLRWENTFAVTPGFEDLAITFPIRFVNMTRRRLRGDPLSRNPHLTVMYDIMTRHDPAEFIGFAQTAFTALQQIQGKWTKTDRELAFTLMVFYLRHGASIEAPLSREDCRKIADSVNMGNGKMNDFEREQAKVFYDFFAPGAWEGGKVEGKAEGREEGKAEGREEGKAEGREEGKAEGREEERVETLTNLRDAFRQTVSARFGCVPIPVESAIDQINDPSALFNLGVFASSGSVTLADLVARAESGAF